MNRTMKLSLFALLGLCAAAPAFANERHFTLTYETATLPAGAIEIEPQTTFRMGREQYYLGMDHRLEFEFGITDRLMAALYLNFGSETARTDGVISSQAAPGGVSAEFKYNLSNASADAIGSALYLELTATPMEYEIEGKLLLDKRIGSWHLATNFIYEREWGFEGFWNNEHKVAISLGATHFFTEHLTAGLEVYGQGTFEQDYVDSDTSLKHGALFAGPVVGYASNNWWIATSVTPQLVGFGDAVTAAGTTRDLEDFHAVQARVILGMHL
jgi:hypothetical protein